MIIMHFCLGYFKGYILWLFGFNHFNLAHCEIHHCLASVWHAVRCWFAFFEHPLVLQKCQKAAIQENRFAAVMRRDPKHAQESCMDVCCEGSNCRDYWIVPTMLTGHSAGSNRMDPSKAWQ
jgi:hypothetical protein